MKAILKFNLPDDAEEFKSATNGTKYSVCLYNLWNELRAKEKYSEKQETTWEEARQLLIDVFDANNISFDEL